MIYLNFIRIDMKNILILLIIVLFSCQKEEKYAPISIYKTIYITTDPKCYVFVEVFKLDIFVPNREVMIKELPCIIKSEGHALINVFYNNKNISAKDSIKFDIVNDLIVKL